MIEIVDERGRKQRYQMSDEGSNVAYTKEEIADIGVSMGVPDLDQIDWEAAVTELHNRLFDTKLFTMDDVTTREGLLSAVVLAVLKAKIVKLYIQGEN